MQELYTLKGNEFLKEDKGLSLKDIVLGAATVGLVLTLGVACLKYSAPPQYTTRKIVVGPPLENSSYTQPIIAAKGFL